MIKLFNRYSFIWLWMALLAADAWLLGREPLSMGALALVLSAALPAAAYVFLRTGQSKVDQDRGHDIAQPEGRPTLLVIYSDF